MNFRRTNFRRTNAAKQIHELVGGIQRIYQRINRRLSI